MIDRRSSRFIVAGLFGSATFFICFLFLLWMGLRPFWASILAYGTAILSTYALQHAWTFSHRSRHSLSFPRYLFLQLMLASASGLTAHVSSFLFVAEPLAIAAITTLTMGLISYFVSSRWVFAEG